MTVLTHPSHRPVDNQMIAAASIAAAKIGRERRPTAWRPRVEVHAPSNAVSGAIAVMAVMSLSLVPVVFFSVRAAAATPRVCMPVTYFVAPDADAVSLAAAGTAFDNVSSVSGIRFVATPDVQRAVITVEWTDLGLKPGTTDKLLGAGEGVWRTTTEGASRIEWGVVRLDRTTLTRPGFERGDQSGILMLHEIGHVLGLPHSDNVGDVMYPNARSDEVTWSAAERQGLREAGARLGCS